MSRIVIDVTPEEHRWLKAMASLKGMTIKAFALDKIFEQEKIPNAETMQALEDARLRKNLESFDSIEEMFEALLKD